jgi:hypothetical protein
MYRRNIRVHFKLAFTMVDGKVINSVTDTKATMRCYLCKSTSKQFNDIDEMLKKEICDDNLQFGISSLHAWIRCMECCLKLSYKLDIKKWQTRKCDKDNKKNVQQGFKERLGLIIDEPKQGYGSSNDGNTARRFFSNYSISAEITGVDEELIRRIYIILQAMSCGFQIDVQKFQKYTEETARKFVELYPWFYMSPTVHKILIHGYKIIDSFLLPIGQRSEEAQESCNKFIKRFREDFARKCSREKNLRDVFQRLLITSDPYISSFRKIPPRQTNHYPQTRLNYCLHLQFQAIIMNVNDTTECSSDEDDESCSDSD